MWTMYDIRHDRYWNEQRGYWCSVEEATLYTASERDRRLLPSVTVQWKFVIEPPRHPMHHRGLPN